MIIYRLQMGSPDYVDLPKGSSIKIYFLET
jgi:hypothetical protein